MESKVWDNFQNCELKIEVPDLPDWIIKGVEETIVGNYSQCLDPVKAKGNCLRVSNQLMYNLSEVGKDLVKPFDNCKILHTKKPQPHFWIFVDGWHIDLTARQFNENERCPKIWKDGEINVKNVYSVEKGKSSVLFYLAPFEKGEVKYPRAVNRFSNVGHNLKKLVRIQRDIFTVPGNSLRLARFKLLFRQLSNGMFQLPSYIFKYVSIISSIFLKLFDE